MVAKVIATEVLPDDVKVEVVPLHVSETTFTGDEKCDNVKRTVPAAAEAGERGQSRRRHADVTAVDTAATGEFMKTAETYTFPGTKETLQDEEHQAGKQSVDMLRGRSLVQNVPSLSRSAVEDLRKKKRR